MFGPSIAYVIVVTLVMLVPTVAALLFGVTLCVRHSRSKPRAARLTAIAIGLMVVGHLPSFLIRLAGLTGIGTSSVLMGAGNMIFAILAQVSWAAGLGLLFWAVFCDATPIEEYVDEGPPVFRYDDGTVADD